MSHLPISVSIKSVFLSIDFFVTYSWVHHINQFDLRSKNQIVDSSHFHQIFNFHKMHPVLLSFFGPCLSSYLFEFFSSSKLSLFFLFESQKYICTSFVCCYVIEAAEKKVSVEGWMIDVPLCCRPTYCTHTVKKACFAKLPLRFAISDVITRSGGGDLVTKLYD